MLELRHLRYFVAVAEELNFSRAAERLHMAQPPLSVAIRQLEQELGTALLTRTTRSVSLTEAGRVFVEGARGTLAELERSIAEARRAALGQLGQLRVAFSWSSRFVTMPALGRAFRASHPEVDLLAEEMWNSRMPDALRSGLVDLAVAVCPEISSELCYETVRSEPLVAVLTEEHRFAGESRVALEMLAQEELLVFRREFAPRLYESLLAICRRAGFEPRVRSESFHSTWELGVLADVPLVALVPESVASGLPGGMVAVELEDPGDRIETTIVRRREDTSASATAFVDVARAVFSGEREVT